MTQVRIENSDLEKLNNTCHFILTQLGTMLDRKKTGNKQEVTPTGGRSHYHTNTVMAPNGYITSVIYKAIYSNVIKNPTRYEANKISY